MGGCIGVAVSFDGKVLWWASVAAGWRSEILYVMQINNKCVKVWQ